MGKRIFIAGCARSGTTLLLDLAESFKNTHAPKGKERRVEHFKKLDSTARNVVLKRQIHSHKTLADLPADVDLIYCVRHPFDTLTSHHPAFPHRRFYVSEERWRAEYAALKRLQAKQPDRKIYYVRYCDLVRSPDEVQKGLADSLELEIERPFSKCGVAISTRSVDKFRHDSRLERYLWQLPHAWRAEIKAFCDEFGFELPIGYVRPASPFGDGLRRAVVAFKALSWPKILYAFRTPTARRLRRPIRRAVQPVLLPISRILPRRRKAETHDPPPAK